MVNVLVAPQLDAADDAARSGVTQRTERLTRDIVTDILEQSNVALFAVPLFQSLQQLHEPVGALAAWRALSARLIAVELGHAQYRADDAGIFIQDHNAR